ncbi:diguanylate cyclase [Halomonas denitrificans]|nr:diguanylate cyclase [Halomonas denitrificans]
MSLMVAAFLMNCWLLVPIFGSLTLHFGQSLALLVLLLFGRRSALLVSLAAGAGLSWTLGGWLGPPLAVLETAAIWWLLVRRVPLVSAALVFWLVIGLPLNYLIAIYSVEMAQGYLWIGVLKQAINGLLNAALAGGAFIAVVSLRIPAVLKSLRRVSLFRQVFSLVVTLIALPAIVVALMIVDRSIDVVGTEIDRRLVQRSQDYALLAESYLDRHETAVMLFAQDSRRTGTLGVAGEEDSDRFARLDRLQQAHPGFLSMLLADADGNIVHGVPANFFRRLTELPAAQRSVADRDYFRVPKDEGVRFLSDGFRGRGFGNDPIVAISAPLTGADGEFVGIVEGSLDLPAFARLESVLDDHESVLVVDRAGRALYVPENLPVEPLSLVDLTRDNRFRIADIDQVSVGGVRYFIESSETADGWTVHALSRTSVVERQIGLFLAIFLAGLTALIGFAWLLSRTFARGMTRPLSSLTEQILDPSRRQIRIADHERISPEFVAVADALDQARSLSLQFQDELEGAVELKTAELERANEALQALSGQDPLTELLNRRGLEAGAENLLGLARREGLPVSLAMIDIDHFKNVNDQHGHAAGDRCLVQLARLMRSMFRRSGDLVARSGGEEFLVLAVGADADGARERLEAFRAAVERMSIDDEFCVLRFTVSVGVTTAGSIADCEFDELIKQADKALYASKRAGRNRITSFEDLA